MVNMFFNEVGLGDSQNMEAMKRSEIASIFSGIDGGYYGNKSSPKCKNNYKN